MSWPSNYSGSEIDAALEKGRNLRIVNNGWIRLESSLSNPTKLGELKNGGNYTTSYWSDGPNVSDKTATPLNITVTTIAGTKYQFATIAGVTYSRSIDSGNNAYGVWKIDQSAGTTNPGIEPPANAVERKTLWLDTSLQYPSLKLYIGDNKWVEVIPANAMQADIYDPQGKKTDIFAYIEQSIANTFKGDVIDIDSHIDNSDIHITAAERDKWNNAASTDKLNAAIATLKVDLNTKVEDEVNADIESISELNRNLNTLSGTFNTHTNNTEVHPSKAKQNAWDSKAEANHTHNLDGKVTVDISHVTGQIPSDMLPYDVKERVYVVNSITEMCAATKNPVHNGDVFCIEGAEGNVWYFVVNDNYLGTTDTVWVEHGNVHESYSDIFYINGTYVLIEEINDNSRSEIRSWYSLDHGVTWNSVELLSGSGISFKYHTGCVGPKLVIAVSDDLNQGIYTFYTSNGYEWITSHNGSWVYMCTYADSAVESTVYAMCYSSDDGYVALGYNGTTQEDVLFVCSEESPTSWSMKVSSQSTVNMLAYGNGVYLSANENGNVIYTKSITGSTVSWTNITNSSLNSLSIVDIAYDNSMFILTTRTNAIVCITFNGSNITVEKDIISGLPTDGSNRLCIANNRYLIVNTSGKYALSDRDPDNWEIGTFEDNLSFALISGSETEFLLINDSKCYITITSAINAFKKFSQNTNVNWSNITNTPNTLGGYGIADAASLEDLETAIDPLRNAVPSDSDLSVIAATQTAYNIMSDDLNLLNEAFDAIDATLATLEAVIQ